MSRCLTSTRKTSPPSSTPSAGRANRWRKRRGDEAAVGWSLALARSADQTFNLAWHCLGRQGAPRGAKTALILCDGPDAFRSWTYGELDLMVRRLAAGLIGSGLGRGDRVMITAAHAIQFVLALFSTD